MADNDEKSKFLEEQSGVLNAEDVEATVKEVETEADENDTENENDEESIDNLSSSQVQKILNSGKDSKDLPKNVRRILNREAENTHRVEDSIKKTKANPRWLVPLFCFLLLLGLVWVVVNYITSGAWPIPNIGNWNLLIGFGIMMVGFFLMMWWH